MSSSRRVCNNDPNCFCYICGEYVFQKFRLSVTDFVKQAYLECFGFPIKSQNKPWAPSVVCKVCVEELRLWATKKRLSFKFQSPMMWREPLNHHDDCYFCVVNINGINKTNRSKWIYPISTSAVRPIRSLKDQLISLPSTSKESSDELNEQSCMSDEEFDLENSLEPRPFNQNELNDLIRDLGLSKASSELLASRLKERNLITKETKVSYYRTREKGLLPFFAEEDDFVYCTDISGLMIAMGLQRYNSIEWRLFIDSSKRSLKCVLLHNGNKLGSLPIAHSTKVKEEYPTIALVMKKIKYDEHKWVICVDLKMVNFLLGQQGGYTKFPCFICLWDSRAKSEHWTRKEWPSREALVPGNHNVTNVPLVSRDRIILPPLHIKLGLMKQYVKALNKDGGCFNYISTKFPNLSSEKLKAGIFDGPQIRKLVNDPNFSCTMSEVEKNAWDSFVWVIQNFLGNRKSDDYVEHIEEMLSHFQRLGCNMSIKIHFLQSHLDHFPENLGDMSEEQGERFHQDIRNMEERYQGRWNAHMMADFCWSIQSSTSSFKNSRKSYKRKFKSV